MVIAGFMLLFWILEGIWRYDKRWIIAIIIFPPLLLIASFKSWELVRARWFFAGVFIVVVLLISGVTGYNFAFELWTLCRDLSIWPYYLLQKLLQIM